MHRKKELAGQSGDSEVTQDQSQQQAAMTPWNGGAGVTQP
jgi:hypothetical protein